LDDSLLQVAFNLESIRYLREGKQSDAIGLINANIDGKLAYLMHYDGVGSTNPEFVRRKKTVLTTLSKEWASYPRVQNGKDGSVYSDPEWQQFRREVESYLKQNARRGKGRKGDGDN
jgi:hypothetical protein